MPELLEDGNEPKDFELARKVMHRVAPLKPDPTGAKSYRIRSDGKSITCLFCGMESHHPEDVRHGYCGKCNILHVPA